MSTDQEVFESTVLPQISPFTVMWEQTTTVKKTKKDGGTYDKKVVVVESVGLNQPLTVEVTRTQYERLRILYFKGIKTFSATEGVENTKGFRNLIISGAALFHEGVQK
jgi:hypothetical protein